MEDYLEHHGVKGMKWGVRKARPASSNSSGFNRMIKRLKRKNRLRRIQKNKQKQIDSSKNIAREPQIGYSEDHIKMVKAGRLGAKNLSDAEIRQYINRYQLEKAYNSNRTEASVGRRIVSTYGKRLVDNVIVPGIEQQLKQQFNKKFNDTVNQKMSDFSKSANKPAESSTTNNYYYNTTYNQSANFPNFRYDQNRNNNGNSNGYGNGYIGTLKEITR